LNLGTCNEYTPAPIISAGIWCYVKREPADLPTGLPAVGMAGRR